MKVLVVGANGQIGKHVVNLLHRSDSHSVRAMVRKEEQKTELEKSGVETVQGDLEGTVEDIGEAVTGCDAIVFTAGSGGKTGPDKTLLIDLDGAVKTMEVAEKMGISRFIMVSALQANNRDNWHEAIRPYFVAKHYADRMLEASGLQYTIIRPGALTNDVGLGTVSIAENLERGSISREDVAKVIVASLSEENVYKRSFDLLTGESEIETALKQL
ncbi:SDR family oxidoreductase [Evansella sp. AB-rgal1]|uniref:SDR family oxidoreductase n=1 Tax=Evansella sp. AB-rgal1 TaxID=3242696 RepID=UPI00359CC595